MNQSQLGCGPQNAIHSKYPSLEFFLDQTRYRLKLGMFEARLEDSSLLKRLFEAVKELCKDVRFDCNENGIALQAMDRYMRFFYSCYIFPF